MPRYTFVPLLAGAILYSLAASSFAKSTEQPAQQSDTQQQADSEDQDSSQPRVEAAQQPLLAASTLEVSQAGGLIRIRVHGLASSDGWSEATLVPLVHGVPSDGVLDLVLVAEPPAEPMQANGFLHMEATLLIEQNYPYKAVRVRTATNVIALRSLPGKAEAPVAVVDCHDCIGRPLATNGADGVKPESLPKGTRILSPTDPIDDVQPNPNRLTLLVGDDGKIIDAVWQ
jgi:hypothetical protein